MVVLSVADLGILPRQGALGKGEARRAYGEGKETSLRPIRRASISTTSLHATTRLAQATGISGQFTLEAAGTNLSAFQHPT
nr:MAG TPA: hypothetical protein [Caudoviricetes sp.]